MVYTSAYSLPKEFEHQAWFTDSSFSHHLTYIHDFLNFMQSYVVSIRVNEANSETSKIHGVGSSYVSVNSYSCLNLNDIF